MAAVRPIFALPIQLDTKKEPEHLKWFPGDQAHIVARAFTKQHGLDEAQHKQVLSAVAKEAKARSLMQPLFSINVTLPPPEETDGDGETRNMPITVYEHDDIGQVVSDFAAAEQLVEAQQVQLRNALMAQARQLDLLPVLMTLNVTIRPEVHETLKLYSGDVSQDAVHLEFLIGRAICCTRYAVCVLGCRNDSRLLSLY